MSLKIIILVITSNNNDITLNTPNGSVYINGVVVPQTTIAITDQPVAAATYYLTFVTSTTGNLPLNVDSSTLTYTPSTDTLNTKNYGGVVGIYQKTTYLTQANNNITSGSIITDGMIYMSTFSSTDPSIANDIITVNLPTPTVSLEGFTLTFRKLRGSFDTASTNWSFVAPSSLILSTTRTLTTPGGANAISNQNGLTIKYIIAGYLGVYYYLQI